MSLQHETYGLIQFPLWQVMPNKSFSLLHFRTMTAHALRAESSTGQMNTILPSYPQRQIWLSGYTESGWASAARCDQRSSSSLGTSSSTTTTTPGRVTTTTTPTPSASTPPSPSTPRDATAGGCTHPKWWAARSLCSKVEWLATLAVKVAT